MEKLDVKPQENTATARLPIIFIFFEIHADAKSLLNVLEAGSPYVGYIDVDCLIRRRFLAQDISFFHTVAALALPMRKSYSANSPAGPLSLVSKHLHSILE